MCNPQVSREPPPLPSPVSVVVRRSRVAPAKVSPLAVLLPSPRRSCVCQHVSAVVSAGIVWACSFIFVYIDPLWVTCFRVFRVFMQLCFSSGFQGDQGSKVHVCETERAEAWNCVQRVWGGGLLQAALQDAGHW